MTKRTDTSILASAMYALARDIDSADGVANAAIFEAAERLELQQNEIEKLTAALGNLLSVIHRDGGQYLAAHGIEKACGDAEAAVAKWIMLESSTGAMVEQAARAEREECARACEDNVVGFESFSVWDESLLTCARAIRARSKQ